MQEETMRKGPWLEEEDERLAAFVTLMGERRWDSIARTSGLKRSGKSCRLRWMNYLRPNLKHGRMTVEEEHMILQLHERWGNKWSRIARWLPGRTDNEIKNYWRSYLRKKAQTQEQEKIMQREIDNATSATEEGDLSIQTTSFEYCGSVEDQDILRTSEHCVDVFGFSDCAFAISPYEARMSDWISGSSNDQDELKHHGECNMLDTWSCCPEWIAREGDGIWDYCSGSLWGYGAN